MVAVLVVIYILVAAVYSVVRRSRAGLDLWRRLKIFGRGGVGIEWFVASVVLMMAWPLTLTGWLATGRPEPRIVFNDKAVARACAAASAQSAR